MPKEEQQIEEGYMPLLVASKQQTQRGGAYPSSPHWEDEKTYLLGVGMTALPLPSSFSPSHVFHCVVLLWHGGGGMGEGGGGGGGEGGEGGLPLLLSCCHCRRCWCC